MDRGATISERCGVLLPADRVSSSMRSSRIVDCYQNPLPQHFERGLNLFRFRIVIRVKHPPDYGLTDTQANPEQRRDRKRALQTSIIPRGRGGSLPRYSDALPPRSHRADEHPGNSGHTAEKW